MIEDSRSMTASLGPHLESQFSRLSALWRKKSPQTNHARIDAHVSLTSELDTLILEIARGMARNEDRLSSEAILAVNRYHEGFRKLGRKDVHRLTQDFSLWREIVLDEFLEGPVRDPRELHRFLHLLDEAATRATSAFFERARVDSERKLRIEKHKLAALFDQTPAALALWRGEKLIFEKVNPEYQKIFPQHQLEGLPWEIALPELMDQPFGEILREVLRTGKPYIAKEMRCLIPTSPGGPMEERYYDFTYARILDAEGKPYGIFDHAVDVTENVRARRRAEESEQILKLTADAVPALIAYLDRDFNYRFVNKGYKEWFGHPVEHYIGRPVLDIVGAEVYARVKGRFERALAGEILQFDEEAHYPQGVRQIRVSYAPDVDPATGEVRGIVSLVQDVSEQKAASDELRYAKMKAEAANEAKTNFLANMSHEMRTPLAAILGFVDVLKDPNSTRAELQRYLDIIERNSGQLLSIIDDILDLAKVESGRLDFESVRVSLPGLLADFASLMGFRAREKGIAFRVEATTAIPNWIETDPMRLRQILTNVVGNAIKFTTHGQVTLRLEVKDEKLSFEIEDTGRGISTEQAAVLFQPFMQADASTTRKFGGTGLGLVLTKRLARSMGGDFELKRSQLNVGSTFAVSVAVRVPEKTSWSGAGEVHFSSRAVTSLPIKTPPLQGLRVLVVDDSPDNQALLGVLLTKSGAEAEFASDGAEGVQKALDGKPDLVLMDIQMPRMDGYQALAELQHRGFDTPVIALTAHAMKEEQERAEAKGFTDFATKPLQRDKFMEILERYRRH